MIYREKQKIKNFTFWKSSYFKVRPGGCHCSVYSSEPARTGSNPDWVKYLGVLICVTKDEKTYLILPFINWFAKFDVDIHKLRQKRNVCLIENYIPKKYGGLIFKHDVFAYNLFCMPTK